MAPTSVSPYTTYIRLFFAHASVTVYRPKLERLLITLKQRLKVPEEERHLSNDDVRKPKKVEIEGFCIWNGSRHNKNTSKRRSTSRPQTPDNRGEATLHSWVQTTPKAGDTTTSTNPGVLLDVSHTSISSRLAFSHHVARLAR